MKTYKEYTEDKFKCPYCGREFQFDPTEYCDYNPEGWNEYIHDCECGESVRYFEIFKFSHYEVYKD